MRQEGALLSIERGQMMVEMSRSGFLKGGVGVGAAALACTVPAGVAAASEDAAMSEQAWDYETDVVVVGSGIGGFCAALKAQEGGADTIIVEVNKWTGGGSAFCGGVFCMMTATDDESLDMLTGGLGKDPLPRRFAKVFYDGLPNWLEDMGAAIINPGAEGGWFCALGTLETLGVHGCRTFFDSLESIYAERGGRLLLETRAEHIMTTGDYDKVIEGLFCKDAAGNAVRIKAKAVVLACGGFQNDSELRVRYIGGDAHMASIMGVPWNTGSGMKMAQELGASLQGDMSGFTSTYVAAYPARNLEIDPKEFINYTFDHEDYGSVYFCADQHCDLTPKYCVLVNVDGKRYVDEGTYGHRYAELTAKQPFATGFMIFDSTGWETLMEGDEGSYQSTARGYRGQFEEVITSDQIGGVIYKADSLEELADQMAAAETMNHRINKQAFLKTMADYNEKAEQGDGSALDPTRTAGTESWKSRFAPIVTPPFYAWPVTAGIYFCHGGVAIDTNAQVLDTFKNPIPGLYAAAPTAGGIMNKIYTGAMAAAATTGFVAGESAAAEIAGR